MVPGLHDWGSAVMVALSALVSGLDAELVRLGYKDSTMVWYRGCWRRLEKFFASLGVEEFSLDLAMAWVDEACCFYEKEQAGTLKQTDVYLFRVAQMLNDYAVHGAVLRRYSRVVGTLAGDGADTIARFQAWLRAADRAVSTVRAYGTVAGEFTGFLDTRGGTARCDAGAVEAFVATLAGYQFKTVEQKLCALRSFLRFASGYGLLDAAVLDAVPAVKSRKQTRIPSVWDPADVTKILDAVDPGSPCPGQREAPPRHAFAQTHAGDPADGGRHPGRADRRHPRSPVGRVDRRVSEIVPGSVGQVRAGSGPARSGGVTMTPAITLTDAITALVAEKRTVGYKYATEARVLGRFDAFCRGEFPGLGAVSQVSVEAWVASARRRGVTLATLQGLAAPVRELARWLGRRGIHAYVLPAGVLARPPATSRTSTRTRNWRRC